MTLCARDLLDPTYRRVAAEDCPARVVRPDCIDRTEFFAVFDGDTFVGLLDPGALVGAGERIFADLLPQGTLPSVTERMPVEEALAKMEAHNVRALAVLDSDGRFTGVLSKGRVHSYMLEQSRRWSEAYRQLFEPGISHANNPSLETRKQERLYETLLHSIGAIVWEADARPFTFSFVSQQAERLLGYPVERWLKDPAFWADHLHPEDRDWAVAYRESATGENRPHDVVYKMVAADGRTVWVRDVVTVVIEADRPAKLRGIIVDITEQKRAERCQAMQFAVTRILLDATSFREAAPALLQAVGQGLSWDLGELWLVNDDATRLCWEGGWSASGVDFQAFEASSRDMTFPCGIGLPGRVWASGRPAWIPDIRAGDDFPRLAAAVAAGLHAAFAFPFWGGPAVTGVMAFFSHEVRPPDDLLLQMMAEVGVKIGQFVERERAGEALRKSNELFHALARVSPVGIFRTDAEGHCIYVNERWCEIGGITSEQARGAGWVDAVHPEDRDRVVTEWNQAVGASGAFESEYRFRRPDGGVTWVLGEAAPEKGPDRDLVGYVGTLTDITERKRTEQARREAEIRYRTLFEQLPVSIVVFDPQTALPIQFNEAAHRQLGYSREEFARLRVSDYEAAETPEETKAHIEKVLREGRDDFETRHRTKQGDIREVLVTVRAIELSGRPVLHSIFHDITERKRAKEALRKSEETHRMLVQNINEIVYLVKTEDDPFAGTVQLVGDQVENIIGYRPDEFLQDPGLWFRLIHPDDTPAVAEATEKLFARKEPATRVYRVRHKETAEYRWMEDKVVPQIDDLGNVIGIFGVARDITKRKQAEDALRESEERFRNLVQELDAIVWEADAATWKFTFVSQRAEAILGYPIERWLMEPDFWINHIHPDDREQAVAFCRDCTLEGRDHEFECRSVAADGRIVWLRDIVHVVQDAKGRVRRLRGLMVDISARKQAEEALRKSQASLADAQRIAHLGNWDWDIAKNELTWSDEIYRIFGCAPQEFGATYEAFLGFVHPDDREVVMRAVEKALHERAPYSIDHRIVRPDGSERIVHEQAEVTFDAAGRPIRMVGTIQDITDRRQAETARQALHQASLEMQAAAGLPERLTRLLQTARDFLYLDRLNILLADPQGQWLEAVASLGTEEPLSTIRVPLGPEGGGLALAYQTQQAVVWDGKGPVPEAWRLHAPYDQIAALRSRAFANLPIVVHGRAIGVLGVDRRESRQPFEPETRELLQLFASQAALAVEQARLHEALQSRLVELTERTRELEALTAIGAAIGSSLALTEVLDQALDATLAVLGLDAGEIWLLDEAQGELTLVRHRGLAPEAFGERTRFQVGEGFPGRAAQTGEPMLTTDLPRDGRFLRPQVVAAGFQVFAAIPLKVKGRVLGTLDVAARRPRALTDRDLHLLNAIGAAIGMAVTNARLYEEQWLATRQLAAKAEELERTQVRLLEAERLQAMGQMAAGVAHDFNNALMAVLGQTELMRLLLAQGPVAAALQGVEGGAQLLECLARQGRAVQDAAETVRKIRAATRPRGAEAFAPVSLPAVAAQVVETTRPRWKDEAEAQGVAITVRLALTEVPPVLGREAELREALTNLLLNAIEALPGGGTITVGTASVPGAAGRSDGVTLTVADTGVGMTETTQQHLFEPFFTTKEHGSGLGLSMVLGIVRRHGGDITVTSAPRQGTTVTLRFPAALGTVPAAVTAASPPAALPRPLCILVIDDVLALAQALAEILRAFGHEAEAVGSGQEGLARLAARRFDLLFTDLGMPEMSGWEVARAAKARWPTLPVVLVTGWGDTLETEPLDGTGVDLILAKPYRREQLEATIAEAWALGQTK